MIRVTPPGKQAAGQDRESQLRSFDQATLHNRKRPSARGVGRGDRGWRREDLYRRDRSR